MRRIPLTQGKQALVDDADYPILSQHRWFYSKGYAVRMNSRKEGKRRLIQMHRVIMNAPAGMEVDHIDGNRSNNTRANLRLCTTQQNRQNCHSTKSEKSTSLYKGVYLYQRTGRFMARIKHNQKTHYLGYFDTQEEAGRAYDAKARELFGDYAFLNFPASR